MPYKTDLEFLSVVVTQNSKKKWVFDPCFENYTCGDLMIRGGKFYALCDPATNMWTTDENKARRIIDIQLKKVAEKYKSEHPDADQPTLLTIGNDSVTCDKWIKYVNKQLPDWYEPLDAKVTYKHDVIRKEDHRSKRVKYDIAEGDTSAWDTLLATLYFPEGQHKIEWAIGSIADGPHVKQTQKYYVIYGEGGTGKSTVLNIIYDILLPGYCAKFSAAEMVSDKTSFNLQTLASNPLVAVDHEAKLSNLADNSYLNSVAAGEPLTMNLKFQSAFQTVLNTTMFMAANEPPKITNRNAGSVRRIVDIIPTGKKIPIDQYFELLDQVKKEAGAIMYKCREVYLENPNYYRSYEPTLFMNQTDPMYNFVMEHFEDFKDAEYVVNKEAWALYKMWCEDNGFDTGTMTRFKTDFAPYWGQYSERKYGSRSVYEDFQTQKLSAYASSTYTPPAPPEKKSLDFTCTTSPLDEILKDCPAQYANDKGTPRIGWDKVTTKLIDIHTNELHYVRPPENLICIDFDIKDSTGEKSRTENLKKASECGLPKTYGEYSKSGSGVHLHYWYDGDPSELASILETNVEIKVYSGKSSLRRQFTYCNGLDVATLSDGDLPKKEVIDIVDKNVIEDEAHLKNLIEKALRKDINPPYTRPCMLFIKHVMEQAQAKGMTYDMSPMRQRITTFAASSSNNATECLKIAQNLPYTNGIAKEHPYDESRITIYDIEVSPNFLGICWMYLDSDEVVRMKNPSPLDCVKLMSHKLVGFNNREYDDYILYARALGASNDEIYRLSSMITSSDKATKEVWRRLKYTEYANARFVSYTDIFDFSSEKKSLKKFEIDLGINHLELGLPWDEPWPEELWDTVLDYCENDVRATKALFLSKDRQADYKARLILSAIAGLPPSTSTNNLTKKIIFGNEKNPQGSFNYRNLADPCEDKPYFPGYTFTNGKSMYRGYEVGEGGFVWAAPGMYSNVITFDVASMHPSSIIAENLFGPYTKRFQEIKDARVLIKHGDFEKAKTFMDGAFAPYLDDPSQAKSLAGALKIAINSVYGLTSANFPNAFKDPRNNDNIVAKRGSLFMVNLLEEVLARGGKVVHIKTDSIKISNPSPELYDFVMDYGKQYGYTFEIEHRFEKICLVNNAVYIAKLAPDDDDYAAMYEKTGGWTATGTQFAVPYVFKTLFSHKPIDISDMCEVMAVSGAAIYLKYSEDNLRFVGKVGAFTPVDKSCGGEMLRVSDDKSKVGAVSNTKGFYWAEYAIVSEHPERYKIDESYYIKKVEEAKATISQFGDFDWLVSD